MVEVLTAEAKITAVDNTGPGIDAVAQKFARLAGDVNKLSTQMTRQVEAAAKAGGVSVPGGASVFRPGVWIDKAGKALASGAMAGAAVAANPLTRMAIEAGARTAHERARAEAAGMTPGEIAATEEAAGKLSQKLLSFSKADVMDTIRNIRGAVDTLDQAVAVAEPLLEYRRAAQAEHPENKDKIAEDVTQMIAGMEFRGGLKDVAQTRHYLDTMMKAQQMYGDTVKPEDFSRMFPLSGIGGGAHGFTDEFMLKSAPALNRLMGQGASSALAMYWTNLVGGGPGGTMMKAISHELDIAGMLDEKLVQRGKTGEIKHIAPQGIAGYQDIKDPLKWVTDYLVPHYAARGITGDQLYQHLGTMATRGKGVGALLSVLAEHGEEINRAFANQGKSAKGLAAGGMYLEKDPFAAAAAAGTQFRGMLGAGAAPLMKPAAEGLTGVAKGLAAVTAEATKSPLAAGAGLGAGLTGSTALATTLGAGLAAKLGLGGLATTLGGGAAFLGPAAVGLAGLAAAAKIGQEIDEATAASGITTVRQLNAKQYGRFHPAPTLETEPAGAPPAAAAAAAAAPIRAEVTGPVTAELSGNASISIKATSEPTPDFWTRLETRITQGIRNVTIGGQAPATGTAGATGKSMPEAGPAPQ